HCHERKNGGTPADHEHRPQVDADSANSTVRTVSNHDCKAARAHEFPVVNLGSTLTTGTASQSCPVGNAGRPCPGRLQRPSLSTCSDEPLGEKTASTGASSRWKRKRIVPRPKACTLPYGHRRPKREVGQAKIARRFDRRHSNDIVHAKS